VASDSSYSWRYAVSWLAVALLIAVHVVFMVDPSIPLFGLIKEDSPFVAVIKVVLTVTLIAVLVNVFSTAIGYLRFANVAAHYTDRGQITGRAVE
jgi:hypothetical protein